MVNLARAVIERVRMDEKALKLKRSVEMTQSVTNNGKRAVSSSRTKWLTKDV